MLGGVIKGRGLVYVLIALVAALALSQLAFVRSAAQLLYEDIALSLDASAERAYEYGTQYFDATHPDRYNIDRATMLYDKADDLNPHLPHLQHQRARIAFLKGDFPLALQRINTEIETNASPSPSSFYIRGLIRGYMGAYTDAAHDYETYLHTDVTNWAAINDYAWVLLKAERPRDALVAVDWGLIYWPENPWLLNSKATAHFELGQLALAREAVEAAAAASVNISEEEWLRAYPGNDPLIANKGVAALQTAIQENMHIISQASEESSDGVQ